MNMIGSCCKRSNNGNRIVIIEAVAVGIVVPDILHGLAGVAVRGAGAASGVWRGTALARDRSTRVAIRADCTRRAIVGGIVKARKVAVVAQELSRGALMAAAGANGGVVLAVGADEARYRAR